MKFDSLLTDICKDRSLPLRGAWIEISLVVSMVPRRSGRSPYGERGLKSAKAQQIKEPAHRRSPYGERGLKLVFPPQEGLDTWVAPLTGSVD